MSFSRVLSFAFLAALSVSHANADVQVNVFPTDLDMFENGVPLSYQVSLSEQPSVGETVTVTATSQDVTEVAVTGPVTFTRSDWDTPKLFTLSPRSDGFNDGDLMAEVSHSVSASGGSAIFNGASASSVFASVINIEVGVLITVNPSGGTGVFLEAGESVDVTFRPGPYATPSNDVSIDVSTTNESISLSAAQLTLTAGNNYTSTLTITASADADIEMLEPFSVVTANTSSSDSSFNDQSVVDVAGALIPTEAPDELCVAATASNQNVSVICL